MADRPPGFQVGNDLAVTTGAYSDRLVAPSVPELVAEVFAANDHLDVSRNGAAVGRYCTILARVKRTNEWLDQQPDRVFSDSEAGTIHRCYERLERWEKQCESAEHRLAIDPVTRAKLGLAVAQVYDLAQAMSAAAEQEGDRD